MPLLRISCPVTETDRIVTFLRNHAEATEIAVTGAASRVTGADVIVAEVPRAAVDRVVREFRGERSAPQMHISIQPSDRLLPAPSDDLADDEAVIWAQVTDDVRDAGDYSRINAMLVVVAACIAAVGIIEDQILFIIGAMTISPDYYSVASVCLSVAGKKMRRTWTALSNLGLMLGTGIAGAWLFTEILSVLGIVSPDTFHDGRLLFLIADPRILSVVVAGMAGVAGALTITLPETRGLVGVFVSITTIPAAANIGVAMVARDLETMAGSASQLGVNVASLIVAGTLTLGVRRLARHL